MHLTLQFELNKPPAEAITFFANPEKFVKTHPVITRLEGTGANTYCVHETLRLGFLPFSFRYPAKIEVEPENSQVIITAVVMKLVRIRMNFVLAGKNGGTSIREEITFGAVWPTTVILKATFRKQHTLWFKNINEY